MNFVHEIVTSPTGGFGRLSHPTGTIAAGALMAAENVRGGRVDLGFSSDGRILTGQVSPSFYGISTSYGGSGGSGGCCGSNPKTEYTDLSPPGGCSSSTGKTNDLVMCHTPRKDGVTESVTILVTRHPQPQCVIGVGSGMEAAVMWNDCIADHQAEVAATNARVRSLSSALVRSGAGPVESVDCFPAFRLFRRQSRREIDAVLRVIDALRPDRIVVDEAHHLCADLRAQIAVLTEATASVSGGVEAALGRRARARIGRPASAANSR